MNHENVQLSQQYSVTLACSDRSGIPGATDCQWTRGDYVCNRAINDDHNGPEAPKETRDPVIGAIGILFITTTGGRLFDGTVNMIVMRGGMWLQARERKKGQDVLDQEGIELHCP